jgi:transposase
MDNIIIKGCGLDVHQASITACIMRQGMQRQVMTFGTTTTALLSLKHWLMDHQITHIAMESTGVYWKPVFNVLGDDFKVLLVNARHIKNVPGRKTDVKDFEWICQLLRAGLLQGSFIPVEQIRQLRDLTRYQKTLQHEIQNQKNRIHKLLQDANIKITSVLSDIFGVTGLKILKGLSQGIADPHELSTYLHHSRIKASREQAKEALTGYFSTHHRFLLNSTLKHIEFLQKEVDSMERQSDKIINHYQQEHKLLQTIPGIKQKAAKAFIAEIGTDINVFPSAQQLSSWAGLCPGNNESAGKKKVQE